MEPQRSRAYRARRAITAGRQHGVQRINSLHAKRHFYGPELLVPPVKTSQSISTRDDTNRHRGSVRMQKFYRPLNNIFSSVRLDRGYIYRVWKMCPSLPHPPAIEIDGARARAHHSERKDSSGERMEKPFKNRRETKDGNLYRLLRFHSVCRYIDGRSI